MKKLLAMLSMMVLVLAGCSSSDEDAKTAWFVTDTGGINDKSFNQGTWEGIQEYADGTDIEIGYTETKEQSQATQNLTAAAADNDIVVAAGYTSADPVYQAATANPDTDFILIDAEPQSSDADKAAELDNVHSYLFKEEQAGYLVGYIAGKETKTDTVGFIGGLSTPPVQRFGLGYVQGVQDANKDAKVLYNYAESFDDVSKGKTTASTMYSKGADIIFTAAGGVNSGVIEAAKEKVNDGDEAWVIGVDRDMYEDGKYDDENSVILTSAIKNVGKAAQKGLALEFESTFEGGTDSLGIDENGIGLPEDNPNLDQKVVDEAYKALKSADVKSTKEDVEANLDIEVSGDM